MPEHGAPPPSSVLSDIDEDFVEILKNEETAVSLFESNEDIYEVISEKPPHQQMEVDLNPRYTQSLPAPSVISFRPPPSPSEFLSGFSPDRSSDSNASSQAKESEMGDLGLPGPTDSALEASLQVSEPTDSSDPGKNGMNISNTIQQSEEASVFSWIASVDFGNTPPRTVQPAVITLVYAPPPPPPAHQYGVSIAPPPPYPAHQYGIGILLTALVEDSEPKNAQAPEAAEEEGSQSEFASDVESDSAMNESSSDSDSGTSTSNMPSLRQSVHPPPSEAASSSNPSVASGSGWNLSDDDSQLS
eukprot:Cvel_17993.t1-p1 / transcript=Cvel_17993.t1 / gene=Cvel_17993 / organism=Chromera_velia_CCMP2878 / gene_product=hypothetical protein / transcript_product=hypothetical protein / location=Cvel_scaffold1466:31024-31926(-) / protein_length=301 / sequence_SO=supercontig / SO=protein_coding / is_pseudo=false